MLVFPHFGAGPVRSSVNTDGNLSVCDICSSASADSEKLTRGSKAAYSDTAEGSWTLSSLPCQGQRAIGQSSSCLSEQCSVICIHTGTAPGLSHASGLMMSLQLMVFSHKFNPLQEHKPKSSSTFPPQSSPGEPLKHRQQQTLQLFFYSYCTLFIWCCT